MTVPPDLYGMTIELIDDEHHAVGVALLERVAAMLTKMIDA